MKRIKRLLSIFLLLFTLFIGYIKTDAATLSLSATASTTSTVVGNTITITFKYSSTIPLGVIVSSVSYDPEYLTLTSGEQSQAPPYDGIKKSDSFKYTFKAKKRGETTVKFNVSDAVAFDESKLNTGSVSKTITIKTQAEIEASYSKNNNLSSLKISAGTLSPAFNKNTLEYTATVENNVTKITVSGSKEDSKSYVDGLREYELEEGNNKISIKVTAQNGTAKTYVINVTRKELDPIAVKTEEGLDLNVIRKKELLKSPNDYYSESIVTINDIEVPALYNEITNTSLVGLRDSEGNTSLYVYKDGKFSLYKELSFSSIIITPIKASDIPDGYIEEKITIDGTEVVSYKNKDGNSNYCLLNGVNIKTGKENLYQYDKVEKTLQIFDEDTIMKIDELNEKNTNYLYIIIGLGSLLIVTYIVILISCLKGNKKRRKEKKKKDFDFGESESSILDVDIKEEKLDNTSTLQEKRKKRRKDSKDIEQNNKKDDTI